MGYKLGLWAAMIHTGGEPTHLAALIKWFMDEARDDIPVRIHSRDTAADGDPEWHPGFRRWLMDHPAATDIDGNVKSPFRFWMWVMANEGIQAKAGARFLYFLMTSEGDWQHAIYQVEPAMSTHGVVTIGRAYALATLQAFWRRMQTEPRRFTKGPKSDAQYAAEENA